MADYLKKFIAGALVIFLFNILGAAISYLMRFVMTSNLTPTDYGLFYSCFSLVGVFFLFKDFGLAQSLVYHVSKFMAAKEPEKLKNSVAIVTFVQAVPALMILALTFIFAQSLAVNYLHLAGAEIVKGALVIKILAAASVITITYAVAQAVVQGAQRMKLFAFMEFSRLTFWFVFTYLFFAVGYSYLSPALGYIATYLATTILFSAPILGALPKAKLAMDKKLAKDLALYGLPIMVSSVAGLIISYTDTIILTFFRTLAEVGIYQTAQPTARLLWFFSGSLAVVLFPLVTELKAKDCRLIERGLSVLYRYIWVALVPAALLAFFFSAEILGLFFGQPYSQGSGVLKILSIGAIVFSLAHINGSVLNGLGKPKNYTKVICAGGAVNLVANILLIPAYGMEGAAAATLLTYLVMLVASFRELKKFIRPVLPFAEWAKTLLSGAISLGAIYLLKGALALNLYLEIAVCLSVFVAVFLALILAFKVVRIEEAIGIAKQAAGIR
ncbi:MAG: flippase [Candidatus Aenigmatarchaeota archaeon]